MSESTGPVGQSDDMTQEPVKQYSFARWKKAELLDLCNKLKLEEVPTSTRKNDLIDLVEEHLYALPQPLETEIEFPELKAFFDSFTAINGEEAKFDDQTSVRDESGKQNYNLLNFKEITSKVPFKFDLQDRFTDIIESTKKLNENVQDFFSSLITISIIFQIIEFVMLIQDFFQYNRDYNIIALISVWIVTNISLPLLFSYYFNFIRYDLLIEIDPMMLNISKGLIFLLLAHSHLDNYQTTHIIDNFTTTAPKYQICGQSVMKYLAIMSSILGNVPFIFAVVGALITLYVL